MVTSLVRRRKLAKNRERVDNLFLGGESWPTMLLARLVGMRSK